MRILNWGRGGGKTRHLIEVSHCRNIPILVHSVAMQKYICKMAQGLGLEIPMPIVVTTLRENSIVEMTTTSEEYK